MIPAWIACIFAWNEIRRRRARHVHHFKVQYYDLRADEPGGPLTYHNLRQVCDCGYVYQGER